MFNDEAYPLLLCVSNKHVENMANRIAKQNFTPAVEFRGTAVLQALALGKNIQTSILAHHFLETGPPLILHKVKPWNSLQDRITLVPGILRNRCLESVAAGDI